LLLLLYYKHEQHDGPPQFLFIHMKSFGRIWFWCLPNF